MKFLRFLCNLCLFFFTTIMISFVQVGCYDIVASQDNFGLDKNNGSSVEIITVIPTDDKVEFIDTFKFWGTDITTGVKSEPKYRIRSWGDWEWWSKNMKWADVALDTTIASVKPIFTPIAQINAIKDYYLTDIYDISTVYHRSSYDVVSDEKLYEMYVLFPNFTYGDNTANLLKGSNGNLISSFDYNSSNSSEKFFKFVDEEYYYENTKIGNYDDLLNWCSNETNYIRWAKRNKVAYNVDWKLQKYNQEEYTKYYKKFIFSETVKDTTTGAVYEVRTIKSSVVALNFIQFTSIIIALVFVIKYPVSLLQARWEAGRRRHRECKNKE